MKPPNSTPPPNQVEHPLSMTITSTATSGTANSTTTMTPSVIAVSATTATAAPPPTTTTTITSSSSTSANLKQIQSPMNATITTTVTPTSTSALTLQQQHQPNLNISTTATINTIIPTTTPTALIASQPTIITKPSQISAPKQGIQTATPVPNIATTTINVITQEQQAPLALTTQSTYRRVQLPQDIHHQQPPSAISQAVPTTAHLAQIQSKLEPNQLQCGNSIITSSPITLATTSTTAGPTALVIIPQQSTGAPMAPPKIGTMTAKTAHSSTIQTMQAPVTTIVPSLATEPITAHQHTTMNQTTMINRPPQTLSVVPMITTVSAPTQKLDSSKPTCCLFDNGIRCDRVAGNASFNARIQKVVATKKLNFAQDPAARHSYICDHHKAIITVAKKTTTLARETKANARNYAANNNANVSLSSQHTNNLNDLSMNQPPMQHQMNLEMLSKQSRLANNHTPTVMSSMPMRPGPQIAYGHYPHSNQIGPMDPMMAPTYDNTGGDSIPSGSGGVSVDLQQLQVTTLRRYKKHFRVQTRPGLNKMQLAESLKDHFRTLPIIEKEAITYFVYIVKCSRNKLDFNTKE